MIANPDLIHVLEKLSAAVEENTRVNAKLVVAMNQEHANAYRTVAINQMAENLGTTTNHIKKVCKELGVVVNPSKGRHPQTIYISDLDRVVRKLHGKDSNCSRNRQNEGLPAIPY